MKFAWVKTGESRVHQVAETPGVSIPGWSWVACPDDTLPNKHEYVDGVFRTSEASPTTSRWPVLKATIRRRLRALGLEEASDEARATLPTTMQNEWADAVFIWSNDPQVISFLQMIEVSPSNIETVMAWDDDANRVYVA